MLNDLFKRLRHLVQQSVERMLRQMLRPFKWVFTLSDKSARISLSNFKPKYVIFLTHFKPRPFFTRFDSKIDPHFQFSFTVYALQVSTKISKHFFFFLHAIACTKPKERGESYELIVARSCALYISRPSS